MSYPTYGMTFDVFQQMNDRRCKEAFNSCTSWTTADWVLAIAGEAGELANLLKKVNRGDFTVADVRQEILKEVADIITYCDLLNSHLDANTEQELGRKFQEVSKRVGWEPNGMPVGEQK